MPLLALAPVDLPAPTEPVRSLLRSATALAWPTDSSGTARPGPVQPTAPCVDGRSGIVDPCGTPEYGTGDTPESGDVKTTIARTTSDAWEPYGVWAGDRCSAFQFQTAGFAERARAIHRADRSRQIAGELWTGAQAADSGWPNLALASANATILAAGANGVIEGLAVLEQGLADCAPAGAATIHVSPLMATVLRSQQLIEPEGVNLRTITGSLVIVDAGYTGSGPTTPDTPGSAADQWMYGTGTIFALLGPVDVLPDPDRYDLAMDRSVNLIEWRAESLDLAMWDGCCHLAVEIDPTDLT